MIFTSQFTTDKTPVYRVRWVALTVLVIINGAWNLKLQLKWLQISIGNPVSSSVCLHLLGPMSRCELDLWSLIPKTDAFILDPKSINAESYDKIQYSKFQGTGLTMPKSAFSSLLDPTVTLNFNLFTSDLFILDIQSRQTHAQLKYTMLLATTLVKA